MNQLLRNLMIIRKFSIDDGTIKILDDKYQMFPSDYIFEFDFNPKKIETASKKLMERTWSSLVERKNLLIDKIPVFFEIHGLGKLLIKDINWKKKACIVGITNIPKLDKKKTEKYLILVSSLLNGYFSVVFGKKVSTKCKFDKMGINAIIE